MLFFKPEIKLPAFPIINLWLQDEYDKLKTEEEIIEFIYKKLNEIETTLNPIRRGALIKFIYPLYSIITNKSYQSKNLI